MGLLLLFWKVHYIKYVSFVFVKNNSRLYIIVLVKRFCKFVKRWQDFLIYFSDLHKPMTSEKKHSLLATKKGVNWFSTRLNVPTAVDGQGGARTRDVQYDTRPEATLQPIEPFVLGQPLWHVIRVTSILLCSIKLRSSDIEKSLKVYHSKWARALVTGTLSSFIQV